MQDPTMCIVYFLMRASKALDMVHFAKLFITLIEHKVLVIFIRLLFILYTNFFACVSRNGFTPTDFLLRTQLNQEELRFYFVFT
jgi:hypothetical protein